MFTRPAALTLASCPFLCRFFIAVPPGAGKFVSIEPELYFPPVISAVLGGGTAFRRGIFNPVAFQQIALHGSRYFAVLTGIAARYLIALLGKRHFSLRSSPCAGYLGGAQTERVIEKEDNRQNAKNITSHRLSLRI